MPGHNLPNERYSNVSSLDLYVLMYMNKVYTQTEHFYHIPILNVFVNFFYIYRYYYTFHTGSLLGFDKKNNLKEIFVF